MITYEAGEDFREMVKKMTVPQIVEMLESMCTNARKETFSIRREPVPENHDMRYRYIIDFQGNL